MARDILIADPNKAAHKAFEEIFRQSNYNLIFSENGEDALLKMKLFKPALVIADITMPDKSGKELCQTLKADPNLNKVPFVLLGGPFDVDVEDEKNQVRADGAITKPLKREPILTLVDGLLAAELAGGTNDVEEEILELGSPDEVTQAASPGSEEEIVELTDIIDEAVIEPKEAPRGSVEEAAESEKAKEPEEVGLFGEKALADLEFPQDMGLTEGRETTQTAEVESPGPGPEVLEKRDLKEEPLEISPEGEMVEKGPVEESIPGAPEGTTEPEEGGLGVESAAEELPTEGVVELPEDVLEGKGLEEALVEEIGELSVEEGAEPEEGGLGVESAAEELPTEGMGELPEDVLKGKGLEEALAEEIEELPEDLLAAEEQQEPPRESEEIPDEGGGEFEDLEQWGEEGELLREEGKILEEALQELPGEALEEGELEELAGTRPSTEEFEGPPQGISQEMDLEGLAQKVLKEEDVETFAEGGPGEEEFEESHEEVFKEGELERLAEEATREQEGEESTEGALAEAIEEFTGEAVREEREMEVRPPQERRIQETISGAVKELVEGVSEKILPQLTEAIAAAAAERIEKTVQRIVPEMAEEAIQKEIRRLERLRKGEKVDG